MKEGDPRYPWALKENWKTTSFKDPISGLKIEEKIYLPDNIRRLEQRYGIDAKRVLWKFVPQVGKEDFELALGLTGWQSDPNLEFYVPYNKESEDKLFNPDDIIKQVVFLDHCQQDVIEIDWINLLAPSQTVSMRGNFVRAQYNPEGFLSGLTLQAEPPYVIRERFIGEKMTLDEFQQEPEKRLEFLNEFINYCQSDTENFNDYNNWNQSDKEELWTGGYRYVMKYNFNNDYDSPEVDKANELSQRLLNRMFEFMPQDDWDKLFHLCREQYLKTQFTGLILGMANTINLRSLQKEQVYVDDLLYKVISKKMMFSEARRNSRSKPLTVTMSLDAFDNDGFSARENVREVWFGGIAASIRIAQMLGSPEEQVGPAIRFKYGETLASQDKNFCIEKNGSHLEVMCHGWRGRKSLWKCHLQDQINVQKIIEIYKDETSDFREVRSLLGIGFQRG